MKLIARIVAARLLACVLLEPTITSASQASWTPSKPSSPSNMEEYDRAYRMIAAQSVINYYCYDIEEVDSMYTDRDFTPQFFRPESRESKEDLASRCIDTLIVPQLSEIIPQVKVQRGRNVQDFMPMPVSIAGTKLDCCVLSPAERLVLRVVEFGRGSGRELTSDVRGRLDKLACCMLLPLAYSLWGVMLWRDPLEGLLVYSDAVYRLRLARPLDVESFPFGLNATCSRATSPPAMEAVLRDYVRASGLLYLMSMYPEGLLLKGGGGDEEEQRRRR
mmetsp:Transcript_79623/g.213293  ORF Transcript_79623/g.213293 Transcript_79623/m.213293 type:complete len:276 (-) Transcript_79623:8-835(-)